MTPIRTQVYERADIVIVSHPCSASPVRKTRPAVVVSSHLYNASRADVVVMAISSNVENGIKHGELLIEEWRAARLLVPSCVKLSVVTLERKLIFRKVGRLTPCDMERVEIILRKILGFYQ